jgi:pullulanase/glycogen debranching enzyme
VAGGVFSAGSTNFAVYAPDAVAVSLCLYTRDDLTVCVALLPGTPARRLLQEPPLTLQWCHGCAAGGAGDVRDPTDQRHEQHWRGACTSCLQRAMFNNSSAGPVGQCAEREGVLHACQVWHVELPGLNESLLYGWRVAGSNEQHLGHRHDATRVVLDPYATTVVSRPTYGTFTPSSSSPSAHTAAPQGVHTTCAPSLKLPQAQACD